MHVIISPGDINSYRVNEQRKYRTLSFANIYHNKNILLGKTRYSLYSPCYSTVHPQYRMISLP